MNVTRLDLVGSFTRRVRVSRRPGRICAALLAGASLLGLGVASGLAQAPGAGSKPVKNFGVSAEIIEVKRSAVASVLKDIPSTGTAAAPTSPYTPADSAALYAAAQGTAKVRAHSIGEYQVKAGTREFKKSGSNSVEIEPSADPDGKTLHANVIVSVDEKKIAAVIVAEDGAPAFVGAAEGSSAENVRLAFVKMAEEVIRENFEF